MMSGRTILDFCLLVFCFAIIILVCLSELTISISSPYLLINLSLSSRTRLISHPLYKHLFSVETILPAPPRVQIMLAEETVVMTVVPSWTEAAVVCDGLGLIDSLELLKSNLKTSL